jgi:DNA-binding NarL/FixJ family response regulator
VSGNLNSSAGEQKRVLVVDDHPLVRRGLVQLMDAEEDLTVCATAASAEEALAAVARCRPDIVLADVSLGGTDGVALAGAIRDLAPDLPVLMFSIHDEASVVQRALEAGARGYVTKHEAPEALLRAVRTVLAGNRFLSERIASRLTARRSGV